MPIAGKRCKHAQTISVARLHGRLLSARQSSSALPLSSSSYPFHCIICLEGFQSGDKDVKQHHRLNASHSIYIHRCHLIHHDNDCDVDGMKKPGLWCSPCQKYLTQADVRDWVELNKCLQEFFASHPFPRSSPSSLKDDKKKELSPVKIHPFQNKTNPNLPIESSPIKQSFIHAVGDKPKPLANYGNTCYQNSTLQALLSLQLLDTNGPPLNHPLADFLAGKCSVKQFHSSFTKVYFSGHGEQEDAHDFLRALWNSLDFKHKDPKQTLPSDCCRVTKCFGGMLQTKVQCLKCAQWEPPVKQTFLDFPVTFLSLEDELAGFHISKQHDHSANNDPDGGSVRREGLLERMVRAELRPSPITGFIHEKCPSQVKIDRSLAAASPVSESSENNGITAALHQKVLEWPAKLIIHVQRFASSSAYQNTINYFSKGSGKGKKGLGGSAWTKDTSPLKDCMALRLPHSTKNGQLMQYELRAAVVHQGRSLHSGHYIALVKYGDEWFYCSDEQIIQLPPCPACLNRNAKKENRIIAKDENTDDDDDETKSQNSKENESSVDDDCEECRCLEGKGIEDAYLLFYEQQIKDMP